MALDLALRLPGFSEGFRVLEGLEAQLDALAPRFDAVTEACEKLLGATERVRSSKPVSLAVRTPGLAAGIANLDQLIERLVTATPKLEAVATAAERIRSAAGRRPRAKKDADPSSGTGSSIPDTAAEKVEEATEKEPRFLSGPNQLLRKIEEQQKLAAAITDATERAAVQADLSIRKFKALRAKFQAEKDLARGDEGIQAPGLLSLFGELNQLIRALSTGNALGAAHTIADIGKGIMLLREKPGGRNVEQKVASGAVQKLLDLNDFILPGGELEQGAEALASATGEAAAGAEGLALSFGPLALAVAAETAAIAAFVTVVKKASDQLNAFAAAMIVGGGSTRDVAALQSYGINPGQAAALARQFRESISTGSGSPFAMLGAGRLGIGPQLPREYGGNVNELELLNRALDRLSRLPADERKSIANQNPLLEQFLPQIEVWNRNRAALDRDTERSRLILEDKGAAESAQDLALQVERVGVNFNLLLTALGKPGLKLAAEWTGKLADALGGLAEWAEANSGLITTLTVTMNPFFSSLQLIGDTFKLGGAVIHWAGDQLGQFMERLRQSPFKFVADGVDLLSEALSQLGPTLGSLIQKIAAVVGFVDPVLGTGLKVAAEALLQDPTKDLRRVQQAHADAMKKHADAMDGHALALRQGTYGGGPRIRQAVPPKLGGGDLNRAAENGMLRQLGAFSF